MVVQIFFCLLVTLMLKMQVTIVDAQVYGRRGDAVASSVLIVTVLIIPAKVRTLRARLCKSCCVCVPLILYWVWCVRF